jgi:hypothetical protein
MCPERTIVFNIIKIEELNRRMIINPKGFLDFKNKVMQMILRLCQHDMKSTDMSIFFHCAADSSEHGLSIDTDLMFDGLEGHVVLGNSEWKK